MRPVCGCLQLFASVCKCLQVSGCDLSHNNATASPFLSTASRKVLPGLSVNLPSSAAMYPPSTLFALFVDREHKLANLFRLAALPS